ncbi:hypothetical protein AMTR_s00005p00267410, partial [Amborella trichopoda]
MAHVNWPSNLPTLSLVVIELRSSGQSQLKYSSVNSSQWKWTRCHHLTSILDFKRVPNDLVPTYASSNLWFNEFIVSLNLVGYLSYHPVSILYKCNIDLSISKFIFPNAISSHPSLLVH